MGKGKCGYIRGREREISLHLEKGNPVASGVKNENAVKSGEGKEKLRLYSVPGAERDGFDGGMID